jgi:hypothetical protein
MKKLIIISLAVVLLSGALGGFAYAKTTTHQPMVGQKLIGWGPSGIAPGNKSFIMATEFFLTNPDCVSNITINKIAIIKSDGTPIYEGPLLVGMQGEEFTNPLTPHQVVDAFLPYYIIVYELGIDPQNPPSTNPKDYWPDLGYYTFEVSWTGNRAGLSLMGSSWQVTTSEDPEGNYTIPSTSALAQMVNMTQIRR